MFCEDVEVVGFQRWSRNIFLVSIKWREMIVNLEILEASAKRLKECSCISKLL